MRSGGLVPMILAAGRATRLRPLTEMRPKATIPFLNRPLLDYTFDWLRRQGHRRVVINLHHGGRAIQRTYGSLAFGMRVDYSEEPVLLGTAGGPRAGLDLLGETTLLVNGDVVTQAALGPLFETHARRGSQATLGLHQGPVAAGYPQCLASPAGELLAFPPAADTPGIRGVFTGIHLIERGLLETLPAETPCGTVDPLYRTAMQAGLEVSAVTLPGPWYEVGTPRRYIAHQLTSLRRGDIPLALRGKQRLLEAGYVDRYAHLENVRMVPPFLLGAGARVKHGASVEASVVGDRCRIGRGSRLLECVAWPGAWIGPRCDLQRVVIMDAVRVPPGTILKDAAFTPDGPVPFAPKAAS